MSAAAVARIGYNGFRQGRVIVTPGIRNRLLRLQSVGAAGVARKLPGG